MRRGLRIGEFQARGADQDLRDGEYAVRNQLPCDGHGGSFLQPVLQESDNQECSGAEGQSRSEAHQGPCKRCHPGINKYGDEGDEHHDENGIGRLDLGRPDGPGTARERDGKRNHPAALGYPGRSRLFENGPEWDDKGEDGEDFQDVPGVFHGRSSAALFCVFPASVEQNDEKDFPEARLPAVPGRRRFVVFFAAQPEDEGGNPHEEARDGKRPTVSVTLFHGRNDQEGEEGAKVDSPVEGIESLGH